MWQANKVAIICLLLGLVALGIAYLCLCGTDPLLARRVLSAGICLLLFVVATATWISARRDLNKRR